MIWQPVIIIAALLIGIICRIDLFWASVAWAVWWPLWFVRILVTLRDRVGLCFDKCIIVLSFDS